MEELIRFLFIAICVLYIIRSLVRYLLPMLFQSVINKATQQPGQGQARQQTNYQQSRPREASVKVDYIPPTKKGSVPDNEGDFVDYEEVK